MRNRREELQYIKGMLEIPAEIAGATLSYHAGQPTGYVFEAGYMYGALKALYKDVVAVLGYIDEVL